MSEPSRAPVLIVGAGPTGLVLALCLHRLGVRFRIVDKADRPGTASRALVVHARTLEFYRQLGVADAIVGGAQRFDAVNLWVRGTRRGRMPFGETGKGLSRFPYSLILPQDEHERILIGALRERGVAVEWRTEVTEVEQTADVVRSTLRSEGGQREVYASSYVAGCDGARSTVRERTGIALPGGTYSHLWYVADVDATGPLTNHEVNISMDERDVIAAFPMTGEGAVRLVGQARGAEPDPAVSWESVDRRLLRELRTQVARVRWFSTYRVHHRVATAFRKGRVFLLGDAAHLHSPVGGQGMNTGIGDAVNLGWKLASVIGGDSPQRILDSYEPERIAFARRLVATTDRVFAVLNSDGAFARTFRTRLVPRIMPLLTRTDAGRRFAFRLVSQIAITYRKSPLSDGRAGRVHAGDRLPWVAFSEPVHGFTDNFAPLTSMQWQLHVYGTSTVELRAWCASRTIELYEFPWRSSMRHTGLMRDAIYLVRPDGHVAYARRRLDLDGLRRFAAAALTSVP